MEHPVKITLRNMKSSKAIVDNIREKSAKLDFFCDRILSCRVVVEAPHRHHHKGKSYAVRIDVTVPGDELVIDHVPTQLAPVKTSRSKELEADFGEVHEPSKHAAHEDVYVAIRDAFAAAGRKLQDYVRRHSGAVKSHDASAVGRVARLFPVNQYGFLETNDGREIYFHSNSVLTAGFDRLAIGTEVHFAEEPGENGPQASTVRLVGK